MDRHPPRTALSAHNLSCIRDDRLLFEGLNFALKAGDLLQIEGHNGSGKTSLLRILCGLSLPEDGEVCWYGESIENKRSEYYAALNYVGHFHGVKGELTAQENLRVAQSFSAKPLEVDLDEVLAKIGLRGFEDVPSRALSAGQRRRVGLARLLLNDTKVWVLDEPFTSLDKAGIQMVEDLLHAHADKGGIAVLTSHHPIRSEQLQQVRLDQL